MFHVVLIFDGAGERDQGFDFLVIVFSEILVHFQFISDGLAAGTGDDHRFGAAADFGHHDAAEMLDNDLDFLGDVVRVQAQEAGDSAAGLLLVYMGVVLNGFARA